VHGALALLALQYAPQLFLPAACLFVVEAVTAFDNGATLLGNLLGTGRAAENLSRARFFLHATCIGLLVPVYSGIGGAIAFTGNAAAIADNLAWTMAIVILGYGYLRQYRPLGQLMPVSALGCLRYAQAVTDATRWPGYEYSESELQAKGGVPLASVMATTCGLLFGLAIGLLGGFWVPFVVTALMFFAGALPQRGWGPVAISMLEIVFSAGMVYSLGYAATSMAAG
jgi:hypothetical protein